MIPAAFHAKVILLVWEDVGGGCSVRSWVVMIELLACSLSNLAWVMELSEEERAETLARSSAVSREMLR